MKEKVLNERIRQHTTSEKIEILKIMAGEKLLVNTSPELAALAVNALVFKHSKGHIPQELNPDNWNFEKSRWS